MTDLSRPAGVVDAPLVIANGDVDEAHRLIGDAKPLVEALAQFNAWKDRGHLVRKGEKPLRVLAPMTYRRDKIDASGSLVRDAAGKQVKETVVRGFKLVPVFDGSQVEPPVTHPHQSALLPGAASETPKP